MATRTRVAIGVIAIVALAGAIVIGGWLGGDDDVPPRPVEWHVERQLGPKEARLMAPIEYCVSAEARFEEPIIDYEGDRAYIELRLAPEDEEPGICFLNLQIFHTKLTLERDLDELTLYDASTDPPEQRWPWERPRPGE